MSKPLVSVLMPVFNAEAFVSEAVGSILSQTHRSLELIIVDDGCTDATIEKIRAVKDARIFIIENPKNLGLAASLNKAISHARGNYLARMDADDISLPDRIAIQVNYLEQNPDVSVLGTGMKYFNYSQYKNLFPSDHDSCKAKLLFNVCFGHPSVMFRASVFDQSDVRYKSELKQYSEDYELYTRLVDSHRFANLQSLKVRYRTFRPSIKSEAENLRKNNSMNVRMQMLSRINLFPNHQEKQLHKFLSESTSGIDRVVALDVVAWAERISNANRTFSYFETQSLNKTLADQTFFLFYNNPQISLSLTDLRKFSFFKNYRLPVYLWAKWQARKLMKR
jgi:glycosyltransferase involved in cell wall biosynthesis